MSDIILAEIDKMNADIISQYGENKLSTLLNLARNRIFELEKEIIQLKKNSV
jgi:hypothetical protein